MTLKIDTIAYTNRLRQLPPVHKLLFALVLLVLTYAAPVPVQVLIAVWMIIWTVVYAGVSAATYFRLLLIAVGFWLFSLLPFSISSVSLADLPSVQPDIWHGVWVGDTYIYLSLGGLQQAFALGIRTVAATACIYFVILTVPFIEIIDLLRRLGCSALLTDLLMLMYRFIFVLLQTASELWTAQQSRGGYRTKTRWLHSLGLLLGQLLHRTLENYRQISLTLAARGFSGDFRVCHSRCYRPSKRYSLEALFGCTVLVLLTGWQHAIGL